MEIKRKLISTVTLEEFADKHGLTLEIIERNVPLDDPARFYARFKNSELRHGSYCLVGAYGNGATEEEAIEKYKPEIEQRIMIINAISKTDRKEILVPRLKRAEQAR